MTIKLLLPEIDGLLANPEERFRQAVEARDAFLGDANAKLDAILSSRDTEKEAKKIYWQTAFRPDLVAQDLVIPGSNDLLAKFAFSGWDVHLFTSRLENLRKVTRQWLFEQDIPLTEDLTMKPEPFTFTRTTTWKAGMIITLMHWHHADEIIFVDPVEENLEAVMNAMAECECRFIACESLQKAWEWSEDAPDTTDPFISGEEA